MKTATLHHEYQPDSFSFSAESHEKIAAIFALYPKGKEKSAIMPLLDLAQRQVAATGPYGPYAVGGGWIPRAAMDVIAQMCNVAPIKVYEVATFYSMYNLYPVGKYLLQVCTTSPCMLGGAGSEVVIAAIKNHLHIDAEETTTDGLFTLKDVECLGACVNAPVVQINDDYYEDLTAEKIVWILDELRAGRVPPKGSQTGRKGSCPISGATTLKEMVK